jgi:hypothetical protein
MRKLLERNRDACSLRLAAQLLFYVEAQQSVSCLLIYGLFNDNVSSTAYIVAMIWIWWLMNDELKRIWKEEVVVLFKVISRHLPGGTENNHEKDLGRPVSGPRFINPGPPKYAARVVTAQLRRTVSAHITYQENSNQITIPEPLRPSLDIISIG